MANHMERHFPGISAAPLFFISTHGFYDIEKYTSGSDPIETVVPPNTLVIETTGVGNLCFFINVFSVMGPLFQNRHKLLSYLGGLPPAEDSPETQRVIFDCLKACQIYRPGAPIANRILEFTGGLYRTEGGIESERTGDYSNMGFFQYEANGTSRPIFQALRTQLIEEAYGTVKGKGLEVEDGHYESYAKIIPRIESEAGGQFKIIFFSSCGELHDTDPPNSAMLRRIKELQALAKRTWSKILRADISRLASSLRRVRITNNRHTSRGIVGRRTNFYRPQNRNGPSLRPRLGPRPSLKSRLKIPIFEELLNNNEQETSCNALGHCFPVLKIANHRVTRKVSRVKPSAKKSRRTH
jgi:hypothetical protein